jgi:S-DNA-T family DNA segregation ATPase FtsK/SpoIIIE
MMMLAISHSPARVQFYCLDFGGGKLSSVAGLPHVSAVAAQGNVEKIGRVLDSVEQLIAQRARSWDQAGIDLTEFRARKFAGKPGAAVPEDGHGDVFLVIDNIRVLQSDYELTNRLLAITESR